MVRLVVGARAVACQHARCRNHIARRCNRALRFVFKSNARCRRNYAKKQALRQTLLSFGHTVCIFLCGFADDILHLVYPSLSASSLLVATNLLRISAFNVVTFSAMQIYVSLLQALDKTKWAVLSLVCAIIVKTVLSLTLVRFIGVLGGAIASLAMGVVALFAANFAYFRICGLHLEKTLAQISLLVL